jgi:hypothetical protein
MADSRRGEFRDCGGRVTAGIRGVAAVGNKGADANRTERGEDTEARDDTATACLPVTVLSRSMQAVGSRCAIASLLSQFPHEPIISDDVVTSSRNHDRGQTRPSNRLSNQPGAK